ncbi:hypothetical protein HBI73_146140 [Parastagonospora nodorum]|nr:hypothetical protein HBI04_167640 [Parastagonospora nodorum]KAH4734876.1 hypothetical protein HBH78_011670 [Parastagonospora nodorum]KAH4865486.1 hypothetical protein HBH59_164940 [Parastagonospora nodorum]KAH5087382.1 hypothetical protein HBI73_146140 [Parastagonospora nodorum]KAH5247115.1 hypothetical protein HBI72_172790 [Parastagonospora nodorum]
MFNSGATTNPVRGSSLIQFEQRKVYEKAVSLTKVPSGMGDMVKSPVATDGLLYPVATLKEETTFPSLGHATASKLPTML